MCMILSQRKCDGIIHVHFYQDTDSGQKECLQFGESTGSE